MMSTPASTPTSTASSAVDDVAGSSAPRSVSGRPRDLRIDDAVLRATTELLEEVGYLSLTIGAVAERAGTNKPAIYRRWATKAQLVHEAVFPADTPEVMPVGDDLRGDLRTLVAIGLEILGRPAVRAAVPGLMAEMNSDPTQTFDLFSRFDAGTWGWLDQRIEGAIAAGDVRPGVQASTVLELIAGSTFVARIIRPLDDIGEDWVDDVVEIIMRGIAA
jgi:AcrR family transcriptional regulator